MVNILHLPNELLEKIILCNIADLNTLYNLSIVNKLFNSIVTDKYIVKKIKNKIRCDKEIGNRIYEELKKSEINLFLIEQLLETGINVNIIIHDKIPTAIVNIHQSINGTLFYMCMIKMHMRDRTIDIFENIINMFLKYKINFDKQYINVFSPVNGTLEFNTRNPFAFHPNKTSNYYILKAFLEKFINFGFDINSKIYRTETCWNIDNIKEQNPLSIIQIKETNNFRYDTKITDTLLSLFENHLKQQLMYNYIEEHTNYKKSINLIKKLGGTCLSKEQFYKN